MRENHMELFRSVDIILYSELILVYIIVNIYQFREKNETSTKLFIFIVYILSIVNVLEGVSWVLNGSHFPWGRQISFAVNTVLLMCNSLPAVTWVAYADYKIFNDIEKLKKRVKWYLTPFYITVILLAINIWTGVVFTIDESNVYSRGPGVNIIALMTYAMIVGLYFRTKKYKKQISGKIMQSIFIFMLIPIIAGLIQMFAYGVLLIWPSFILASLIAFFQIEKDAIQRDPLTGLAIREQLEQRAHYLMNKNIGFSVVMLDMNDFKSINDQFGHFEGDQALIITASILRHNVKAYDLICRYGGDEFIILVESDEKKSSGRSQ
jgi:GGDEF domain-containing protein